MRKAYLITCCLLLLLWQIFAVIINNDVIRPQKRWGEEW